MKISWSALWHPVHVVTSLDKTHFNDYLCLVGPNERQINWTKIRRNSQKLLSRCGFLQTKTSYHNEKSFDREILSFMALSGDIRINMHNNNIKNANHFQRHLVKFVRQTSGSDDNAFGEIMFIESYRKATYSPVSYMTEKPLSWKNNIYQQWAVTNY